MARRARAADFEALLEVLDPDVVLRADAGSVGDRLDAGRPRRGELARQASAFSQRASSLRPVLINGAIGSVTLRDGQPFSIAAFDHRATAGSSR